jgi:hypothetical protein
MKKKFYLLALLTGLYSQSYALQKIYVFYVNGIQNSQDEARINAEKLDEAIAINSNIVNTNGRVVTLYNKKGYLSKQTLDVMGQKISEKVSIDDYIKAHRSKFGITNDYGEEAEIRNILLNYFSDERMGNNFSDLRRQLARQIGEPNPKALTQFIRKTTANNYQKPYILFIPHSQGNLYANNLYQLLKVQYGYNEHNMAIYGIASPAAYNLGNYISRTHYNIHGTNERDQGYITADTDAVINGLRTAGKFWVSMAVNLMTNINIPTTYVLPENIKIPSESWFSQNHGLVDTYLTNKASYQRIQTGLRNILHYFWLANIYADPTAPSYSRQLAPDVALLAMQDPTSTLSIQGIMANGKCNNGKYFTTYDNLYDEQMGAGTQCIIPGGTYNLVANNNPGRPQIKLLFNNNLKKILFSNPESTSTEPYCVTDVSKQANYNNFFLDIYWKTSPDQNCGQLPINNPNLNNNAKAEQAYDEVGKLDFF